MLSQEVLFLVLQDACCISHTFLNMISDGVDVIAEAPVSLPLLITIHITLFESVQHSPKTPEEEKDTHEVQTLETKKKKGIDDDLDLYYKLYNRYKPEAGESNAESAARSTVLEAEYLYLLMKKNTGRENVKGKRQRATKLHHLSPVIPPRETLEFKVTTEASRGGHSNNNVLEISIETDYSFYPSQDKPIQKQPINIIYDDTGAAISTHSTSYTS